MKRIIWSRFLRRCFLAPHASRTRTVSKRLPRALVRPGLETLEDRTLLSTYVVNQLGDSGAGAGLAGDIRYCINQANLDPGSTITFNTSQLFGASGSGTIALNNGELPIKVDMTIQGSATGPAVVTISGKGSAGSSRVFDISSSSAIVTISDLTITDGNANVANTTVIGNQGGDIFNGGNLTLQSDIVSNGVSSGNIGGPIGRGGAIYNAEGATAGTGATLTLSNTIVQNSVARGSGGGNGEGGGIYNDTNAMLSLQDGTQIKNNQALGSFAGGSGLGGGVFNNIGATLHIQGSSANSVIFADNLAQGANGISFGTSFSGGNGKTGGSGGAGTAGTSGGNASGGGVYSTGKLTLQGASFLGNRAVAGNGGNGGNGGSGGSGSSFTGGAGGAGGTGGTGGTAQGGGLYNGVGALTASNVLFGTDTSGKGNEVLGGAGGSGGSAGAGGKGKVLGGKGGTSGFGGAGGLARGGALANFGGDVAFTNAVFTSNEAVGGNANNAGAAANAGAASGTGAPGGAGGVGKAGGRGGDAVGGGVFNGFGNFAVTGNSTFDGNQTLGGNGGGGGAGGAGGTGGGGTSKIAGGKGGAGGSGGIGGVGGSAMGGGFYNMVGTVTVNGTSFTANGAGTGNQAISGNGGNGGAGGNGGSGGNNAATSGVVAGGNAGAGGVGGVGGNGGLAEGAAFGNQGGDTTVTTALFTSNLVQTGTGGNGNNGGNGGNGGIASAGASFDGLVGVGGNGGTGGTGGTGFGGALAVTIGNLTVTNSTFGKAGAGNQVVGSAGGTGGVGGNVGTTGRAATVPAGNGGQGGTGGAVSGGALATNANTKTIQLSGSTFDSNAISSGAGGAGGQGGQFSRNGATGGLNGQGGTGGLAQGGAISFVTGGAQTATLTNDTIVSSSATGGVGGAGTTNKDSAGSTGGTGGSVEGVGLADVNYNLAVMSSTFNQGTGTAGLGGAGGSASATQPFTFGGGNGGQGGSVLGGGVFVSNNFAGTLAFSFNGGSASNNQLQAGAGGVGGNAGASGHSNVPGGAGGNGGNAQGGGLYTLANSTSINNSTLTNLTLAGNAVSGGTGGAGGAGFNALGGNGGSAQGGAVFNTSLNGTSGSSLTISDTTLSGNQASGGVGGNAGSGTTPNGGAGGAGGAGGNSDGAGLYNGNNEPLTVVNSTFGGSASGGVSSANYNILSGGRGGSGGDAGTPTGVPSTNGGAGGAGGSIAGANVFNASAGAFFINDTIVYGQAVNVGSGGPGGSGAGKAGQPGAAGLAGTGTAGGYFAAAGSSDSVGNSIIALNNAATAASADVSGTFTSLGNNILSTNAGVNGFAKKGDKLNVTATQLNLGPLLNNGGPTMTDALLNNGTGKSVAIDAGGNTLVTASANPWITLFGSPATDQRGVGFQRIYIKTVDVGAFEFSPPTISGEIFPLGANVEQGSSFTLTINGSGFVPGATVNWNFTGSLASYGSATLTPTSVTNTQIIVTVPASLLPDEGTVNITVSVPDGSGVSGEVNTSAAAPFTITEGSSLTLSNPGSQTNNERAQVKLNPITSSDPDTTFNDLVNGQHTLPTGLTIDPSTGVISGTIDPYAVTNGNPSQVFNVTINGLDEGNVQGSTTFSWTVNDTTAPTLVSPGNLSNNESDAITPFAIAATDADTGTFTDLVNGKPTLPTGLTIDGNGVISGTIAEHAVQNGQSSQTFAVTISASDNGHVGITTFNWTVNDTQPPDLTNPAATSNGILTNKEGDSVNIQVQATDADSFSAANLPTGLSINTATGVISGTIDPRAFTPNGYNTTITATDNGYSSSVNFTWVVQDTTPPAFTNPGTQNNNEGDVITNLATNPVDADPGTITDTVVVNGTTEHTLPTGLTIDPTTGSISGTIDPRAAGSYLVTITGSDGGVTGSTIFTWNVADTTPPGFTNPGTLTNNEGDKISGLALNPVDADQGSITATGLPSGLNINPNTGVITGTIGKFAAGTYNVKVSATDGAGLVGSTTFTWIVNDTTTPSITNPGDQSNNEGDTLSNTDKTALQIRATDAESFVATGLPTGLSIDAKTGLISGTIDPYGVGVYHVTVTVSDGLLTNQTAFTWTVADSSPPSFASLGTLSNNEGDPISLATKPVDADPGSITATGLPTGLSIDATSGLISGTIDPRAAGSYTVTLSATDGSNTGTSTFTWNVADTTPPALNSPGTLSSLDGTPIAVAIHAADGDSFSATGLPAGLSINPKSGVISGTLLASAGTYQVTVNASDGGVASSITFPWVVNQMPISVAITNIHNIYVGLYQVETVTAQVSNPQGIPVNQGFVTFEVNGEAFFAPVSNGFATATFATPMLSFNATILLNDLGSHPLDAIYSDPAGIFGTSGGSVTEPAMLLDFLLFLQTAQFSSLAEQLQQLQSS